MLDRLMKTAVWAPSRLIVGLQSESNSVSLLDRLVRSFLFLPLFLMVHGALCLHTVLAGAFSSVAKTLSGAHMNCVYPDMIQTHLHLFGVWEPDITRYIKQALSPGDTFVDVGANIGYHTLLASDLVGTSGRVLAIGASPSIYDALRKNLKLNGDAKNVRALNMAVAAEAGRVTVYRGPAFNLGISSTVKNRLVKAEQEVDAAPLGAIVNEDEMERLRLVKIDVEGAEETILPALGDFLGSCSHDVEFLVELTPIHWRDKQATCDSVLRVFFEAGFHPYRIRNSYAPWRYLWPNMTTPLLPLPRPLKARVQVDLLLSRRDAVPSDPA